MTGHIHADLMAMYAEDAKTHAEPWLLWELFDKKGGATWHACTKDMSNWHPYFDYRRKPRTLTVTVPWFPEPMREAPEMLSAYYMVTATGAQSTEPWTDHCVDHVRLAAGICHATREAAEQHAAAILALNKMERAA